VITIVKAVIIAVYALIIAILTILVSPFDSKGKITHYISKIFSKVILLVSGIKLTVNGLEKIDKDKSYVFVSNHASYFDIPILMQAIPNNVRFIYKKSMNKIPIFGWGMYLGQYVPIDRENGREAIKALRKAAEKIKKGISIVIFPEGTRSPDGEIKDFKKGVFVLADEAKEDIVPVLVKGSYDIMPKGKFKIKSANVEVTFFEPIKYSKDKALLGNIRELLLSNVESV
jgi:1-acyl-sn-glycerol-3-phosphate acyltransferase